MLRWLGLDAPTTAEGERQQEDEAQAEGGIDLATYLLYEV